MRALKQAGWSIVYCDESGFEPDAPCLYGWSPRGVPVYGERSGERRPRENLLAARTRQEWLAPLLFPGSVTAQLFEQWLSEQLIPSLLQPSVLVLDNAAFHRPHRVTELMEQAGHRVLFLPPYSPDFNPIEGDFAALKKKRAYESDETSLDELVASYQPQAGRLSCSYLK